MEGESATVLELTETRVELVDEEDYLGWVGDEEEEEERWGVG